MFLNRLFCNIKNILNGSFFKIIFTHVKTEFIIENYIFKLSNIKIFEYLILK